MILLVEEWKRSYEGVTVLFLHFSFGLDVSASFILELFLVTYTVLKYNKQTTAA